MWFKIADLSIHAHGWSRLDMYKGCIVGFLKLIELNHNMRAKVPLTISQD